MQLIKPNQMSTVYDRARTLPKCQSPAEWEPILKELFEAMDMDKDGKISWPEHERYCNEQYDYFYEKADEAEKAQRSEIWNAILANPDDPRHPKSIFAKCDTDGDGFLTFEELRAGMIDICKLPQ